MPPAPSPAEAWLNPESWPPPLEQVARARLGDPKALAAVYRSIQPRLNAFLRYHGFETMTREEPGVNRQFWLAGPTNR